MKPDIGGEATSKSTRRALRGDWGQRAGKDQSRILGDPAGWSGRPRQRSKGIHNRGVGPGWESERPIVVKKRGNARGAKGPHWKQCCCKRKGGPLGEQPHYGSRY